MTTIVKEFEVGAPPQRVFAAVANPERYPRWAVFVKAARTQGPRTHWVYELGRMQVELDTEETVSEPNRIYGFRQTAGFLKSGETRLEIRPTTSGSSVTWTNEYELPYAYLGDLMDRLQQRKQFEEGMDRSILRLKTLLEA